MVKMENLFKKSVEGNKKESEMNKKDEEQGEAMEHFINNQENNKAESEEGFKGSKKEEIIESSALQEEANKNMEGLLSEIGQQSNPDRDIEKAAQAKELLGVEDSGEDNLAKEKEIKAKKLENLENASIDQWREYITKYLEENNLGYSDEAFETNFKDPETGEVTTKEVTAVEFINNKMQEINEAKRESLPEKKKNWFKKKWENWKNASKEKKAKVYKRLIQGGAIALGGGSAIGGGMYVGHQLIVQSAETVNSLAKLLELL